MPVFKLMPYGSVPCLTIVVEASVISVMSDGGESESSVARLKAALS